MAVMPMFPLGSVLLPGGILPLHVFEPRYRDMVRDCLRADGEPEFGQALISHGWETGGGDDRVMVGTVAQMLQVDAIDENRYALVAVGTRRIRINAWLPDDPFPVADIDFWPDDPPSTVTRADLDQAASKLEQCIELARRAGIDIGRLPEISDEIEVGSMQLSALAPISAFDKQRLLEAPGPDERLPMLDAALADALELLEFRLQGPDSEA